MRWVPVREAVSAIIRVGDNVVGGLGAGGAIDARLEDILRVDEGVENGAGGG
jgi:hypothetical protein